MSQSSKMSVLETLSSTAIGFGVAVLSQMVIFPIFNVHVSTATHFIMSIFFTIVSVIRGYFVRRLFNTLDARKGRIVTFSSPPAPGTKIHILRTGTKYDSWERIE